LLQGNFIFSPLFLSVHRIWSNGSTFLLVCFLKFLFSSCSRILAFLFVFTRPVH
jgi:hypothetical protein